MLEFQEVTRKRRPLKAVQVGVNNAAEIAKWCGGEVVMSTVRMMGTEAKLPAVKLNRPSAGGRDYTTALVTFWVVEYPNEMKIYKDEQFKQLFEPYHTVLIDEKVCDDEPNPPRLGTKDCPIPLVPGDYVFQSSRTNLFIPHSVVVQIPHESSELSGEGVPPLPSGTYSRSDFGLPPLHTTQDPNAQMLGLMSYAAAGNDLADVLKEGIAQTKAVEEFQKIHQIEEARLYSVGPVEEEQWIDRELVMPEGMGTNTPEHTAAGMKFLERINNQGRISMEDVTDPFHEPPNPTPAGESLEFEAGHRVKVIDKDVDEDWVDREGTVTVVGVMYDNEPNGVEVEFDEGLGTVMNPKVTFHPTQLKRIHAEFVAGDKVQVTAKGEWYQWDGVVKFVDPGRDNVVGVQFMDDVREYREFMPSELKRR